MDHPIGDLMTTTLQKLREMMDVNTIVGESITTPDGVTLIPISKVSMGFVSGGSDFSSKSAQPPNNFGGGSGAGVNITPVAFLVVKNGTVRVLPVTPPAANTVDRIIELVPEVMEKVSEYMDKKDEEEKF